VQYALLLHPTVLAKGMNHPVKPGANNVHYPQPIPAAIVAQEDILPTIPREVM
jgi:hypothetical protein